MSRFVGTFPKRDGTQDLPVGSKKTVAASMEETATARER